jgi:hypothetical protein
MAKRCGAKRLGEEESTIVKKIRDKKMGRGRKCWQKDVGQRNWELADFDSRHRPPNKAIPTNVFAHDFFASQFFQSLAGSSRSAPLSALEPFYEGAMFGGLQPGA